MTAARMRPGDYLAAFVGSRALYRALYEEGRALLAPQGLRRDPEPIESVASLASLAGRLRVARSTIAGELTRLRNAGWLLLPSGDRAMRCLGHREGRAVYLLADREAEFATGERLLVARVVLRGLWDEAQTPPPLKLITAPSRVATSASPPQETPPRWHDPPPPRPPDRPSGRGFDRRWNP